VHNTLIKNCFCKFAILFHSTIKLISNVKWCNQSFISDSFNTVSLYTYFVILYHPYHIFALVNLIYILGVQIEKRCCKLGNQLIISFFFFFPPLHWSNDFMIIYDFIPYILRIIYTKFLNILVSVHCLHISYNYGPYIAYILHVQYSIMTIETLEQIFLKMHKFIFIHLINDEMI
jgi:hypothetical protein